jgi:enediyne polyketide synthase
VAKETGENLSVSATRVWGAVECLRKIGYARTQLTADTRPGLDRWVVLRSGDARIATFPTAVEGVTAPVVFAMLTEGGE